MLNVEKLNTMKKTYITLLIGFLSILITQSQTIDKYSISGKGTIDFLSDFYPEGFEINAFSNSYLYSIGYYYGEDYEVLGDSPTEKYNQLNLLFGKYIDAKNEEWRFQYQAGIGMFWGKLRTDELDNDNSNILTNHYITKNVTTVGFSIKIGGRYVPFNFLSIGVDLQANINFEKSIIRPMLSIEIGKLKSTKKE